MASQLSIEAPTVEQHPTGFGIGTATPRLSWRFLTSSDNSLRDWEQTAYELHIVRSGSQDETYHVRDNASVLVPWPSSPLRSREIAQVRVRAYGCSSSSEKTESTLWSPWRTIECGLLDRSDWVSHAIASPAKPQPESPLRPVRFRKQFECPASTVGKARLYITSLGVYSAFVNGHPVGDQCLAPGWTSYRHRLNYQVFDIASLLNAGGPNVIAVEVAEGWYATRLGFLGGRRQLYGDRLAALAQLEINFGPGKDQISLCTDSTWICTPSAIVRSEFYDGEVYDAREEDIAWNRPDFDPTVQVSSWVASQEIDFPKAELVAPDAPPVRITQEITPVSVQKTPSGATVVDFGQNLVGRLRVRSFCKPSGCQVSFTHAEVLENGEFGDRPLRQAKCIDKIIFDGSEIVDWSPQYTFHGFRFVQVDGWDEGRDGSLLVNIKALVMHTDMTRSGWFSCSNPMVNQLHTNAWWSMRGNFLSIPTDCPQRDERLGWTGDIQIFTPSANFLYNTAGMLGDWLQDVAVEQLREKDRCVPPFVVPNIISEELWPHLPQAVWDDVVILTPWALYLSYGDRKILSRQHESMLAWIDRGIRRGSDGLWDIDLWQLGDWLDPTAPPEEPGDARTNGTLVADAYLVHITFVMSEISKVLNKGSDAARFKADYDRLKTRFQGKYIAASGLLVGDTQTALSLAIMYDLHPKSEQAMAAASRLSYLVRLSKFRVATGFAGTPIITHALTKSGNPQLAYRMLLEKSRPSWMYPITMGATTVWERWDSMLPDGSINPGEMTSFNHYALGSIINWLHSTVAGISPLSAGWKQIRVAPVPGGTINSAEAMYDTPYGRLECRWWIKSEANIFNMELLVPPNSRALVNLPCVDKLTKYAASHEDGGTWVGSGHHKFSVDFDWQKYSSEWPPKQLIPIMRKPEPEDIA